MRRNVIGAPVPTSVLATAYARLQSQLDHVSSVIAAIRVIVCGGLLLLLFSHPETSPTAQSLLAVYTIVAAFATRSTLPALARLVVVADVIFTPLLLVSAFSSATALSAIVAGTGCWVFLNALTGNVRHTRDRIAGYLAMTVLVTLATHASLSLVAIAVVGSALARTTVRVQQYRLIGRTLETAERIQRRLAIARE